MSFPNKLLEEFIRCTRNTGYKISLLIRAWNDLLVASTELDGWPTVGNGQQANRAKPEHSSDAKVHELDPSAFTLIKRRTWRRVARIGKRKAVPRYQAGVKKRIVPCTTSLDSSGKHRSKITRGNNPRVLVMAKSKQAALVACHQIIRIARFGQSQQEIVRGVALSV